MAPKGLSKNQRWLLFHVGGWRIVDALVLPAGADQLVAMTSASATGQVSPEAPNWLGGWEIRGDCIRSRNSAGPRVEITAAQLARYAAALPDTLKAELAAASAANSANAADRGRFCACDHDPCERGPGHVHDLAEVEAVEAEHKRIREWGTGILRRALYLGGEQLGLFEVAS
ncbi:hypothetical protein [Mycolicibacterium houstonense]|uniref:hypothetical protein n=1 Tax=Mycolicibacterium houstonense TaxID=146021 RepID=UPI003F9C1221